MNLKGFMLGMSLAMISSITANAASTRYDDLLHRLIPPNISYTVKIEKNSQLEGFAQLNIGIEQKKTGTIFHRYIWISRSKKLIVPVLLEFKDGKIERVLPKKIIERVPVDISWLSNLVREFPDGTLKSYGKGKTVYLFSDPLCPFCKREIPRLMKLAGNGKIRLYVIPFDVHGVMAEKGSAIFLSIVKDKGLKAAINEIEGANFTKVEKRIRDEKNINKLMKKYGKLLKNINQVALSHGLNGTPVIIIPTNNSKGYVIIGLSDITPYVR